MSAISSRSSSPYSSVWSSLEGEGYGSLHFHYAVPSIELDEIEPLEFPPAVTSGEAAPASSPVESLEEGSSGGNSTLELTP
jgi:hypothetical protein